MSANSSTAITGQSSNVGPLVAAVALAAAVAVGAVGLAITHGVGTTSTTNQAKAGPAIVAQSRIAATKDADSSVSLGTGLTSQYGGSEFGAEYDAWMKGQQAAIAATKDADASVSLATGLTSRYGGSEYAAQYQAWLKGQQAAVAASFPDYFQRINGSNAAASPFVDGPISTQHRLPQ